MKTREVSLELSRGKRASPRLLPSRNQIPHALARAGLSFHASVLTALPPHELDSPLPPSHSTRSCELITILEINQGSPRYKRDTSPPTTACEEVGHSDGRSGILRGRGGLGKVSYSTGATSECSHCSITQQRHVNLYFTNSRYH
ncbi:hypothetical protein PUN28_000979 [Cardiocondyla obscurior]|uniref:Uncharacterized protein n=1 Tax=Cardiocondyla obscurior TaxID=286306 RepID=A0AAW2H2A7_9HYME